MQNSTQVDVGIMIYGKPYQTAVSLHTLYKYSKQHINKIYVTFEKVQPFGFDMDELKGLLEGLPVVYNVSERFFNTFLSEIGALPICLGGSQDALFVFDAQRYALLG
jgi:hypothetical protein